MLIPNGAKEIIKKLEDAGYEAYVVGGSVRDFILGREPGDWDIATSALPEEMMEVFRDYSVIPTGIKHGTLTILLPKKPGESDAETSDEAPAWRRTAASRTSGSSLNDKESEAPAGADVEIEEQAAKSRREPYEVTTYRVDGNYADGRHPENVKFVKRIDEDLARRDFTINAIAYNDAHGMIDPFGGKEDIKNGLIRCVGDPRKRFTEDALRILRALRFSSELGFDIERETSDAVFEKAPLLDKISAERIRVEFEKLLCGKDAMKVLSTYRDIIARFIPEIRDSFDRDQMTPYHIYDVWTHILHAVDNIPPKPILRLAAFFHDIGKPSCMTIDRGRGHFYGHGQKGAEMTNEIMRRLKYDNATRHTVVRLIKAHDIVFNPDGKQPARLLHRMGEEELRMLIEVERADVLAQNPEHAAERAERIAGFSRAVDKLIEEELCFSMKDLAVKGGDILAIGVSEGPEIGEILKMLLEKVVDGELPNDKDALLAASASCLPRKLAGSNLTHLQK